jgi:Protein of unknown function (DUF805)
MKLIRFFANFEGRIPRKTFWLAHVAVFIIDAIVATIVAATAEALAGETAGTMTMHIVTVALFYPQFVIALKRAPDDPCLVYRADRRLCGHPFDALAMEQFRPEHLFLGRARL